MKSGILSWSLEGGREVGQLLFELWNLFPAGDGGQFVPNPAEDAVKFLIELMAHGFEFGKM